MVAGTASGAAEQARTAGRPATRAARHPFVELTITRLLTMVREPEMIFWVFIFPILMALALGIAFRGEGEAAAAPGVRYIDWLIPGLLGMNIMGTGMWGIGFGVVVQRSRKLLKRLIATPMRRAHFLASLIAARLVLLGLEVAVVLVFARVIFRIPIEGSLVTLAVIAFLGAMTFGGLGLLTASRARTIEGISGIMNFVMAPMWLLSGVFFASTNFPDAMQPFIQALPLTALIDALRGVMLEGAGVVALRAELLNLVAWGGGCFWIALRVFRWR